MDFKNEVYRLVKSIPKGKVLTYGRLAIIVDSKSPCYVGHVLHLNNDPAVIPCHRVVFSTGKLAKNYAFGGESKQKEKLLAEGVFFLGQKVDLGRSLWLR